jgi:hypothetical protein
MESFRAVKSVRAGQKGALSAAELLPPKPATWEKSPETLAREQACC